VKSIDGGLTWSAPVVAVTLEDGVRDYPRNAFGEPTLTDLQIRLNTAGNVVAAPSGTLCLVFSDNSRRQAKRRQSDHEYKGLSCHVHRRGSDVERAGPG